MQEDKKWVPCQEPKTGDILRWNEPLWAPPNKPRGKRDKIGEQQVTAKLITMDEFLELKVISVSKLSGEVDLQVKENDEIRRKKTSIDKGDCCKQVG